MATCSEVYLINIDRNSRPGLVDCLRILLPFEISNAPMGSSFAAGPYDPAGLKDIFLCSDLDGDEPRTCS